MALRRNALRPLVAAGVATIVIAPSACGDSKNDTSSGGSGGSVGIAGSSAAGTGTAGMGTGGQTSVGGQLGTGGQTGSGGGFAAGGTGPAGGGAGTPAGGSANGSGGSAGAVAAGGSNAGGETPTGGGGSATGGGGGGGSTTECSGASTLMPGDSNRTVQVGGVMRSYVLHVPASYDGTTPMPLVLDYHGIGGTGSGQRRSSGLAALSDTEGFVIAWPNGVDNAWNVGPCCTYSRDVDDVGFARAIVDQLKNEGCIDGRRVYAAGFSMGGGMSHYLACHAADVFAAVAPSAFDLLEENAVSCEPSRPISVLSFRGTFDFIVPYSGGPSTPPNGCCPQIHFMGAEGTLAKWAELNDCTGSPTNSGSAAIHTQCAAGVEVGLQTIQGGSHAPGPAAAVWDFLKSKSLP